MRNPRTLLAITVVLLVTAATLILSPLAFAHDDTGTYAPGFGGQCGACHFGSAIGLPQGPHGGFASTTNQCAVCHEIHDATTPAALLPRATLRDTCMMCHDGTQTNSSGVYGAITSRGLTVGAGHSIDSTRTIPGGDPLTGGSRTVTYFGEGGNLSCGDCHSPHNSNTVAPFRGERNRDNSVGTVYIHRTTNKLLKKRPTGATTDIPVYGSDWCGACHAGRLSGGTVHNHPVDSSVTQANPFYYAWASVLTTTAVAPFPTYPPDAGVSSPTGVTVMGSLGATNRGYLMPWPRTATQTGHLPICQQCHEDARYVGQLQGDGSIGLAARYYPGYDGTGSAQSNPWFQNFPHETTSTALLIERGDDLCTNCHPPLSLP